MSQKAYLDLTELGFKVHVELAHNEAHMLYTFKTVQPDVVVCPFLTKRVPSEIWKNAPTLIVHPGIKGDRGASSLDHALRENAEEWGVTILQAAEEMDAGDIYSSVNFNTARDDMNTLTKSSIYKNEVIHAAVEGLKKAIFMIRDGIKPEPLNYNNKDVKGALRPNLKISERKINWNDSADIIAREVRAADGRPGVLSAINDVPVYLHGAHVELTLNKGQKYTPGTLIAKRDEGVCVACGDSTAIWFTALKLKNSDGAGSNSKLPALFALPSNLTDQLSESKLPLEGAPQGTWKEIWTTTVGRVCYLYFNFHNGAMHTSQCKRLANTIKEIHANSNVNVLVLMGGHDYFSNGIHLNVIESAEDPAHESWENINAINDIIFNVMNIKDKITVAAFRGNAGAGGVMMALGCDYVFMGSHVVLNPHYKSMHLYGSEYWTYNLPKRVGREKAVELTEGMQPLSANQAKQIGLVDDVFGDNYAEFEIKLKEKVNSLCEPDFIAKVVSKKLEERNSTFYTAIQKAREHELAAMKLNFQDQNYIQARKRFVNKESCGCTPSHFPKIVPTSCQMTFIRQNSSNNLIIDGNNSILQTVQ